MRSVDLVNLYAESSAVLAWLLGEDASPRVRHTLTSAEIVIASELTLIECERVLIRAVALGETTEASAADRRAHLNAAAAQWNVLRIGAEIVDRAKQPFPMEPIRTLDAIHLASALIARSAVVGLEMLSLDDQIRRIAVQLGFRIQPD
jgi:predicted nucleic acid-binding protein